MGNGGEAQVVAVVAGDSLFRAGLAGLLAREGLGSAVEAAELPELPGRLAAAKAPAPVLLLIEAEAGRADAAAAEARRLFPKSAVVLLSDDVDIDTIGRCFAAGLDGYLLKDIGLDSLADSLRLVRMGEKVFPSRLASIMADCMRPGAAPRIDGELFARYRLSGREAEVLRCLVAGDSNKLIARRLDISEATVKVHLKSILKKMGATNRTQAAILALGGGAPDRGPRRAAGWERTAGPVPSSA